MKLCIIIPADPRADLRVFASKTMPPLQHLQDIVDGFVEIVPHWTKHIGQRCVAFCNEEGKLRGLPINERATAQWYCRLGQRVDDVLVGDIVVVIDSPPGERD